MPRPGQPPTLLREPRHPSDTIENRVTLTRLDVSPSSVSVSVTHPHRRWRGFSLGALDAETLFQSCWGAVLVLLVATRNDWPVSLLGVCVACFYFGVFVGAHAVL